jgi:uncharacterized protein with NRDE domain
MLWRPRDDWPLLLAANRDEMRDRPAAPPARHWDDRPDVVAGMDRLAGGSWLGINDHGLVASVMNREGSLGPVEGKRSRGELVLEALDHAEAGEAAGALADLNPDAYRAFNLFLGDPRSAFWLRHRGTGRSDPVEVFELPPGLHMLTARELDDDSHPRIRLHLPRFRAAAVPDPERGDWAAWRSLLASRIYPKSAGAVAAMNLDLLQGFGTVSSALIALPAYPGLAVKPIWLHADGPPHATPFEVVDL